MANSISTRHSESYVHPDIKTQCLMSSWLVADLQLRVYRIIQQREGRKVNFVRHTGSMLRLMSGLFTPPRAYSQRESIIWHPSTETNVSLLNSVPIPRHPQSYVVDSAALQSTKSLSIQSRPVSHPSSTPKQRSRRFPLLLTNTQYIQLDIHATKPDRNHPDIPNLKQVSCRGEYGRGIQSVSCKEALEQIPDTPNFLLDAQKRRYVKTPVRYSSCKFEKDLRLPKRISHHSCARCGFLIIHIYFYVLSRSTEGFKCFRSLLVVRKLEHPHLPNAPHSRPTATKKKGQKVK